MSMAARAMGDGTSLRDLGTLFNAATLADLGDDELLGRYLASDSAASEAAFRQLVDRHGPMVLGVCRRVVGDRHEAEDAFQAAFVTLSRRARSIRRSDSIAPWLHRVARRIAVRAARRARPTTPLPEGGGPAVTALDDPVARGELRAILDQEIDRLPHPLRQAVVLCDLQEMTDEQAGARLGWPVGTVKSRLSRARARLRDRLSRRGIAPALLAGTGSLLASQASASTLPPALADAAVRLALVAPAGSAVPILVAQLVGEEARRLVLWKLSGAIALASALAGTTAWALVREAKENSAAAVAAVPKPDDGDSPLTLSASGQVIDADGRPVANARVYIREWVYRRTGRLDEQQSKEMHRTGELPDILATASTDADGRFRLADVAARSFGPEDDQYLGKTYFPWDLVVIADGHGVAWARLTPQNQRTPLSLKLPPERPLLGRITEPNGTPLAGVRIKVADLATLTAPVREFDTSDQRLGLNWSSIPLGATTDADGRFTIHHLPPEMRATLVGRLEKHAVCVAYAATTDQPQLDVLDVTFNLGRRETSISHVHTGIVPMVMKRSDHRLNGRLVYEGTGEPVAGAMVFNSNERLLESDADGRFALEELTAGEIVLHARAKGEGNDWAPLAVKVEIPDAEATIERTFTIPKGLQVSGRAVDSRGKAVPGVTVRYENDPEGNNIPSSFLLEAKTDAEGRFRLAVPAGKGWIVLVSATGTHRAPSETRGVGSPPSDAVSRPVGGPSGGSTTVRDFVLLASATAWVRALDEQGRPVEGAEVRFYRFGNEKIGFPRTDALGNAKVPSLDSERPSTLDLIHVGRKLGRSLTWSPKDLLREGEPGPLEVRLQPLASLTGQVLGTDGQPIVGPVIHLRSNVKTPEEGGIAMQSLNRVDADGTFRFDGLIPEGSYYVEVEASGYAGLNSVWFDAQPAEVRKLEPMKLPIADRRVEGIVVDRSGKAVERVSVGLNQRGPNSFNQAGTWFMDTDASGRFALTNLPRGPLQLMVYRHGAPGRSIQDPVYVEVTEDQGEVRIVLPDKRRRLEGIEGEINL